MKKLVTLLALTAMILTAGAQPDPNSRRTVIVDQVSGQSSDIVKYQFINGLAETTRLNVYDSRHYDRLPQALKQNIQVDAILTAQVDSITTRKVQQKIKDKDGNPYTKWQSRCYVTMKVLDAKSRAVLATRNLKGFGSHDTDAAQAEESAIRTISVDLNNFVDDYWPVSGEILTVNEVSDTKAKTVTINLGSASSVYSNMQFYVYNADNKRIGGLKMAEISSSDKSLCTVRSGGDTIMAAIANGETLKVISHRLDIVNDILTVEKKTSPITSEPKPDCNKIHTVLYTGAIGLGDVNHYIDQGVLQELLESKRLYALSLEQYNKATPEQRQSLVIDGIMTATAGFYRTERQVKDSYTSYSTKGEWMLMLTDAHTSEILFSETYPASGFSIKTEQEAVQKAFSKSALLLDHIIDKAYPIYTTIKTVDLVKKDKAKTVTIGVGSQSPVYEKMKLDVYVLNADNAWTSIGELKVDEIKNENETSCSVSKGAAEIKEAVEADTPTRVVTKAKEILGGLLKW